MWCSLPGPGKGSKHTRKGVRCIRKHRMMIFAINLLVFPAGDSACVSLEGWETEIIKWMSRLSFHDDSTNDVHM